MQRLRVFSSQIECSRSQPDTKTAVEFERDFQVAEFSRFSP